jgi:hypothetical protein
MTEEPIVNAVDNISVEKQDQSTGFNVLLFFIIFIL